MKTEFVSSTPRLMRIAIDGKMDDLILLLLKKKKKLAAVVVVEASNRIDLNAMSFWSCLSFAGICRAAVVGIQHRFWLNLGSCSSQNHQRTFF